MDAITIELIQKVQQLPLEKQKAVLQIVNSDFSRTEDTPQHSREEWRKQLLECSVWSDEQIHNITETRRWMNQWQTESL